MGSKPVLPASPFILITKPEEIRGHRTAVARHVSKVKMQRKTRRTQNLRPSQIAQDFLAWRTANVSSGSASSTQTRESYEQALVELTNLVRRVPASVPAMYSLQNFFEANPTLYFPAQVMLDAGSPHALEFFRTLDLRRVYHAVSSVLLGWLHLQYPSTNPLSAALFHQTRAISLIRQRLSVAQHDDETYLILLCVLQTDALLGNQRALMAHQRGLEALSTAIGSKVNAYCRALKPKHDFLINEAGNLPYFREEPAQQMGPLQYPEPPYSKSVTEMLSHLPIGQQEIAYQHKAISEELMVLWATQTKWNVQIAANRSNDRKRHDVRSSGFVHNMMSEVWSILERTGAEPATLERFICISMYTSLLMMGYRWMVLNSTIFRVLGGEAFRFICEFHPQTPAEFQCLMRYSMPVIEAFDKGPVIGNRGQQLVRSIKARFSEMEDWDALAAVLYKFPMHPAYAKEWKSNWLRAS